MKTTAAQNKVLAAALAGAVRVDSKATGNAFSALARAGLMTHSASGSPEPSFFEYVIGSRVFITDAGRAQVSK